MATMEKILYEVKDIKRNINDITGLLRKLTTDDPALKEKATPVCSLPIASDRELEEVTAVIKNADNFVKLVRYIFFTVCLDLFPFQLGS